MIGVIRHTDADLQSLLAAGVNPDSTQPREHAVPCQACRRPTWNVAAHCDLHYVPHPRALVARAEREAVTS